MFNFWKRRNEGLDPALAKRNSWSLRKERRKLIEELRGRNAVDEEYKTILARAMNIDEVLRKRTETRMLVLKTVGGLGLGGAGLFLAYHNDTSENPVFRKETQGIAQRLTGLFKF